MKRLVFAALLLGCGPSKWSRGGEAVTSLDVRSVAWTDVPLGKVSAVAEADDVVAVFSDRGVVVLAGGAELAVDASVTRWVSATNIPAADGNGTWMVGVDADGLVYRVRDRRRLELVSPRWGLAKERVRDVVGLGQGRVAFALSAGLALADGDKVARYDYAFGAIAGGAGHGVGLETGSVHVFDPFHGVDRRFAVPEARSVAIDDRGRLVVANDHAIWSETDGRLALRYRATLGPLHGLASAGERVWFAEGNELGVVDGEKVAASTAAKLPANARLVGSASGDVWALADGQLLRFSSAKGASTFDAQVAPIARRVCGQCHGPGTMLELVTKANWETMRANIEERVVKSKTMPPAGTTLTESERAAIAAWATR